MEGDRWKFRVLEFRVENRLDCGRMCHVIMSYEELHFTEIADFLDVGDGQLLALEVVASF